MTPVNKTVNEIFKNRHKYFTSLVCIQSCRICATAENDQDAMLFARPKKVVSKRIAVACLSVCLYLSKIIQNVKAQHLSS